MNLNKANLSVGLAASKDPARINLNSIHVTSGYTEATNGHILARVSLPEQIPCDDLPVQIKTEDAEHIKPFLVSASAAMQMKPFKLRTLLCLNGSIFVDVEQTNANGVARFTMTNLESTLSPELQKIDDTYPDIDRVIPQKNDGDMNAFHTYLDIAHLETLLAIAKSTGASHVAFDASGKYTSAPIKLTAEHDGQTFTGVIMPSRE